MRRFQAGQSGLSLVEVIIGFLVIAIAGAVLFTHLSASYRFSGMTRNRTAAALIAGNFVEEVRAHNYGQPAPLTWPALSTESSPPTDWDNNYDPDDPNYERIEMLVYGKPARMVFYRQFSLENGSFLDKTINEKTDKVKLKIWWREEATGKESPYKSLDIEMGVRSPW